MKVLIADDDVYTREGLVEAIEWRRLGIQEILQAVVAVGQVHPS
ncbi:hypothetical protein OHJ21_06470 [Virgibacillus sp. LDC1]|nr:hypothetical protein [Virgibacillus sp. LDC1]PJN54643.1 hypothetical protein PAEVO_13640 [Paenibacillus sp. GM2FR]